MGFLFRWEISELIFFFRGWNFIFILDVFFAYPGGLARFFWGWWSWGALLAVSVDFSGSIILSRLFRICRKKYLRRNY